MVNKHVSGDWTFPVEIVSTPERDWFDYAGLLFSFSNVVLVIAGFLFAFFMWKRQQNRMKVSKAAEDMLFALIDFQQILGQARHLGRFDADQDLCKIYAKRYEYLCDQHDVRTKLLVSIEKIKYIIPDINLYASVNRLTTLWDVYLKYFDLLSNPDANTLKKTQYQEAMDYFAKSQDEQGSSNVISEIVNNANAELTQYIQIN